MKAIAGVPGIPSLSDRAISLLLARSGQMGKHNLFSEYNGGCLITRKKEEDLWKVSNAFLS